MNRSSGYRRQVAGQALIETLLVLPVLVLSVLLILQLFWLGLAQATVQTAVNYSTRAGTIHHGDRTVMERTFIAGVASLVPQWFAELPPGQGAIWQAKTTAAAQQWAHFRWAGKLQIHSPTAETLQREGELRYDLKTATLVHELAVDHANLRSRASGAAQQWQAERMLDVEVWWCLPLEIPLAGQLLGELKSYLGTPAQRFCQQRQLLSGQPYWALAHRVAYPLLSGYRSTQN